MQKQILPAVAAIIFNEKGEILLQKRGDVDQWCIISGHVEFDETVEEAIIREIKEELGVKAEVVRLIGVYSSPESQVYHYPGRDVHYITTYFEAKLLEPLNPDIRNGETSQIGFFDKSRIPGNMALINKHWLEDALDKKSHSFIR